jgi:class 3 adenylate cyclase
MNQVTKCDICEYENPKGHFYCGRCGYGLTAPDDTGNDTSIINAPIEGERKQVTIIFADISGFTALNDAAKSPAEVEQVVRLINLCLQELSEAIYEFDGYIDKYIGDAIMAIFGAPRAHEDDPERALRAALAMQERLEQFNQNPPFPLPEPLGIHMGINTGLVIAGMVGARRRSYTVMGDAVNVASRLEGVSERGEILISESTHNLTNRLFVFEEREAVKVKGKREPLVIYELKATRDLSQTQRGLAGMEAPLIGREYETGALIKMYHQLSESQGGVVVVAGDAGLGKSRLISDFRKHVNKEEAEKEVKPLWLFGRGLSYRQHFANRLFVDILHSYLQLPENPDTTLVKMRLQAMGEELFGVRAGEVVPYLGRMLGIKLDDDEASANLPPTDPQILQQRTFLAMGEWVEILATKQPVILVFEDLHWADPSSVDLIEYLFTLTMYHPVLIICVTRPDRASTFWEVKTRSAQYYPENFEDLLLWPLNDEESRQLIKHLLKLEEMPEAMENLLLSRAEGNPLFLEEVLRSLIEEEAIIHEDSHWHITRPVTDIDIPNTLQGVLTARIDRLDEKVKRVLQIAAVIGRVFPHFVLAPVVGDADVLETALEELELAELIEIRTREPEPEYLFKHVLTYETAYNSLLHEQRKIIHKQIADHMARLYWQLGEEYAPNVAEHYYRSETWPRAMRYLHRAAEAAIQSFANQEAVKYYTRALEVADIIGPEADQAEILAIYEGRARMLTRMGEPQKAIDDFEVMLAKAKKVGDEPAQMRALNGIGALLANHFDFTRASEFFHQALEVARRIGDERGIADTLSQLGNFYYEMGQLNPATQCYKEASEIGNALGDENRRVEADDGLAKILLEQGEIDACLERYQEIIDTRRLLGYRTGLMTSLSSVLMAQIFTAEFQAADETAEEVLSLHEKSGYLYRVPFIKYYQAFAQLQQGELGLASENLREGLRVAQEQEQTAWQAFGLAWLTFYYLIIGLNDQGLEQAEKSVDIAQKLGSALYEMRAHTAQGAAYRYLGRHQEAITELEMVLAQAKAMNFVSDQLMILYYLIQAYMDTDQWDKAQAKLERMLTLATTSNMRIFAIQAQWLYSLFDIHQKRYEAALNTLFEASSLAEQYDNRLSQYLIQIQKSYIYHISGNSAASRDAMAYAQKIQKRLADNLSDEIVRQAFLQNIHAQHLQEMVDANAKSGVKVEAAAGDIG